MTLKEFKAAQNYIAGKTIALVYIFEGEDSKGFEHYDIWKSDVISEWLNAIHTNHCRPLILDVRTFIEKAMNHTLPSIDFVLNLNAGNTELSTLGLVPSVCSFLNIPCIPCNTTAIIAGEHKGLANDAAAAIKLNIPPTPPKGQSGILRPINFGSSKGVKKGVVSNRLEQGIFQKFIKGYDITTPILYNPLCNELQVLPTVMYYPEDKDIEWFFNEEVKEKRGGYKKAILTLEKETEQLYLQLARRIGISCYCRIDARVRCGSEKEWAELCAASIPNNKVFFIEINPMPTLKANINFHNSIDALNENYSLFACYSEYVKDHGNKSQTGFILLCSILANLKPSIEEKRI